MRRPQGPRTDPPNSTSPRHRTEEPIPRSAAPRPTTRIRRPCPARHAAMLTSDKPTFVVVDRSHQRIWVLSGTTSGPPVRLFYAVSRTGLLLLAKSPDSGKVHSPQDFRAISAKVYARLRNRRLEVRVL